MDLERYYSLAPGGERQAEVGPARWKTLIYAHNGATARGTAARAGRDCRPALGKPPAPVPRSCSSCFIWSRSGIGNSFNRNLAPARGAGMPASV